MLVQILDMVGGIAFMKYTYKKVLATGRSDEKSSILKSDGRQQKEKRRAKLRET